MVGWITVVLDLLATWLCLRCARYPFAFIGAVVVFAASAGSALMAVTRRLDRAVKLGTLGMVLVLAFVAARATSFHPMDELIGLRVLYLWVNWILEIGGIAVVIAGGAARWGRGSASGIAEPGPRPGRSLS